MTPDQIAAIEARAQAATQYPGFVTVEESARDVPALLAHVRDLEARLGRVADELHHAEDNGHRLDGNCQGVSPGQRIPAVRIDFIRAAITDEPEDQA